MGLKYTQYLFDKNTHALEGCRTKESIHLKEAFKNHSQTLYIITIIKLRFYLLTKKSFDLTMYLIHGVPL